MNAGSLRDLSLVELLKAAELERRSAVLRLKSNGSDGAMRGDVVLRDGRVVGAAIYRAGGLRGMADALVEAALCSPEDAVAAMAAAAARMDAPPRALAEGAARVGVSYEMVVDALTTHIREVAATLREWRNGTFELVAEGLPASAVDRDSAAARAFLLDEGIAPRPLLGLPEEPAPAPARASASGGLGFVPPPADPGTEETVEVQPVPREGGAPDVRAAEIPAPDPFDTPEWDWGEPGPPPDDEATEGSGTFDLEALRRDAAAPEAGASEVTEPEATAAPPSAPTETDADSHRDVENHAEPATAVNDEAVNGAASGDAAMSDAAPGDAAMSDAATGDEAMRDAATGDAAMSDAATGDAATGDADTSEATGDADEVATDSEAATNGVASEAAASSGVAEPAAAEEQSASDGDESEDDDEGPDEGLDPGVDLTTPGFGESALMEAETLLDGEVLSVMLEMGNSAAAIAAEANEAATEFIRTGHLVLVDEDGQLAAVLIPPLREAGYVVHALRGRAAAIEQLSAAADAGEQPLVVCDLLLAREEGGMLGGLDVAAHAATLSPPTPIILLAQTSQDEVVAAAAAAHVRALLPRPLTGDLKKSEASRRALVEEVLLLVDEHRPLVGWRVEHEGGGEWATSASRGDEDGWDVEGLAARAEEVEDLPDLEATDPVARRDALWRETIHALAGPLSPPEILLQILRFGAEIFPRGVLFTPSGKGGLRGFGQFGVEIAAGVDPDEAVRQIRFTAADHPGVARAIAQHTPVRWETTDSAVEAQLVDGLGGVTPSEVFLGPVICQGRLAALLYADMLPDATPFPDTTNLEVVLAQAGLALDRNDLETRLRALEESTARGGASGPDRRGER